ncbi:hypothetical protein EBT31_08670 [bacterium]|nr:hypothetical protein [bacterium]NBX49816.1 hypothetical protein [bacterium]
MQRCQATTQKGVQCRRAAIGGTTACTQHSGAAGCPVCLLNMSHGSSRTLPCSHTFHTRCLDRWKRTSNTCPMCRAPFDQPQYRVSLSVHHLGTDHTVRDSYVTSNVTQMLSTFGLQNLQPRYITDIFFDIGFDEFIDEVFQEIGVRLPEELRSVVSGVHEPEQSPQPQP